MVASLSSARGGEKISQQVGGGRGYNTRLNLKATRGKKGVRTLRLVKGKEGKGNRCIIARVDQQGGMLDRGGGLVSNSLEDVQGIQRGGRSSLIPGKKKGGGNRPDSSCYEPDSRGKGGGLIDDLQGRRWERQLIEVLAGD